MTITKIAQKVLYRMHEMDGGLCSILNVLTNHKIISTEESDMFTYFMYLDNEVSLNNTYVWDPHDKVARIKWLRSVISRDIKYPQMDDIMKVMLASITDGTLSLRYEAELLLMSKEFSDFAYYTFLVWLEDHSSLLHKFFKLFNKDLRFDACNLNFLL